MSSSLGKSVAWLQGVARDFSQVRFTSYLRVDRVSLKQRSGEASPLTEHMMSMILISSSGLRVIFKAHFNAKAVGPWAANALQIPLEDLRDNQISDFIKEFCNLVAGALKHELELHGLEVGISLPIATRGFDDIFFPIPDQQRIFSDRWEISTDIGHLTCSSHIEIPDLNVFTNVKVGQTLSSQVESGTVEDL